MLSVHSVSSASPLSMNVANRYVKAIEIVTISSPLTISFSSGTFSLSFIVSSTGKIPVKFFFDSGWTLEVSSTGAGGVVAIDHDSHQASSLVVLRGTSSGTQEITFSNDTYLSSLIFSPTPGETASINFASSLKTYDVSNVTTIFDDGYSFSSGQSITMTSSGSFNYMISLVNK